MGNVGSCGSEGGICTWSIEDIILPLSHCRCGCLVSGLSDLTYRRRGCLSISMI